MRARPVEERFAEKYVVDSVSCCWLWVAAHSRDAGYGFIWNEGRMQRAHRVAYEIHVGPIPNGLTIDHLCRNTRCVNPAHLEAVTAEENVSRARALRAAKTHCVRGHLLAGDNVYVAPGSGSRGCRTCRSDQSRNRRRVER